MHRSTSAMQLGALVLFTSVIVVIIRWFIQSCIQRKGCPLPPGPTPLPLLGNILSINVDAPWLTYTKWRATYGELVYLRLLDTDTILLNSPSVAMELLGKRSHIYSDRPFIATVEPFGHGCNFALSRYGRHWRLCRRIFHQTFHAEASLKFRPMQLRRAHQMIINIVDDPNEYPLHYSTFSAAVAMSSVYDYEPKPRNDPMVLVTDSFLHISLCALAPEKATLLKLFPFLLYIPTWLPGSHIRRDASEASALGKKANEMPYEYVLKRMERKENINDTMVFNHIVRMQNVDESQRAEYETALKHASITAFLGSAETTSTTIMIFTLAMVKNPRVWKRAQAEIDAVVGIERLPGFEDRQSLPYVDAIIRETFRWKPLVPLGVPHATTQSDTHDGYYIPKGATVVANIWGMFYDEIRYPNPELFHPERFLDTQGQLAKDNPAEIIFGFGRRACPGRHAADASVWSAVATMLATLEFNAAKGKDGQDVVFEAEFMTGMACRPKVFPCRLTPRAHINKEVLEHALVDRK